MVTLTNAPAATGTARKRRAAAEPTARYRVKAESWMEDARGLNELRAEGAEIDLTEAQANFLLRSDQIELVGGGGEPVAEIDERAAVLEANEVLGRERHEREAAVTTEPATVETATAARRPRVAPASSDKS